MSPESVTIVHDETSHRFLAAIEGQEAYLSYRTLDGVLDFYYTYVPEVFRGHGIAEQLCKSGFEYAKANSLKVIPTCPYISDTYLKRHPEYKSLTE